MEHLPRWLALGSRLLAGSAGLFAGIAGPARAQDTTRVRDTAPAHALPPLTVSAVRQRAAEPPVVTLRVDSARVRKTQAGNAWDLVRRTAGVEVHEQGQGPGFASDAVIRGFTSDHSSDVLLLIDGVPINLPLHGHVEGYSDWNVLFPGAVSSLRVIHGPSSPLYGNFAYGGVVDVETPWSADGWSGSVQGSSFGDLSGWLLGGARREERGWIAGGRFERSEGWRDHARYLIGNGLARGRTEVGVGWLEGGMLLYGSTWDSPGFVGVADFNAGNLRQAGDPTDGGDAGRAVLHGRYTRLVGQHGGLSVLGWAQALRSHVFLNVPEGDAVLSQTEELDRRASGGAELTLDWHLRAGDFILGAGGRFDDVRYRLAETESRQFVDSLAGHDGEFGSAALFGRWRRLFGSLLVDAGMRLDALRFRSADLVVGSPSVAHTEVVLGPKLGARYLLNGQLVLLGSVSRGFRSAPGVIADPARQAQTTWAKELAVEYAPGTSRLRLALFRLDVRRERIQDPITREISDAGSSVRQGIDAEADVGLSDRLRLTLSGTLNDATVSGTATSSFLVLARDRPDPAPPLFHLSPLEPGDPVPGVSRYLARIGLDTKPVDRITLGGLFRLNGPFTPIGEPDIRTRVYGIFDLNGSVLMSGGSWAFDIELQNVLGSKYPEVRSSGYLNPGAPRALRVAVRF